MKESDKRWPSLAWYRLPIGILIGGVLLGVVSFFLAVLCATGDGPKPTLLGASVKIEQGGEYYLTVRIDKEDVPTDVDGRDIQVRVTGGDNSWDIRQLTLRDDAKSELSFGRLLDVFGGDDLALNVTGADGRAISPEIVAAEWRMIEHEMPGAVMFLCASCVLPIGSVVVAFACVIGIFVARHSKFDDASEPDRLGEAQ